MIGRTTKRNSAIWNEQFTVRRAQEPLSVITTYIVSWSLWIKGRNKNGGLSRRQGKPTGILEKAEAQYEKRKEHAVFVELIRYDNEEVTVVRRFCNLLRYIDLVPDPEWVLEVDNPPYELE